MRLAILGADDDLLRLLRWAKREGGHELVAAYAAANRTTELKAISPGVRISGDWEELIYASTIDTVLIASATPGAPSGHPDSLDQRGDQLRRLAQAGVPLLVVCPACEAIVGFEIEMIRRDLAGVIVPYIPGALHPAVNKLVGLVTAGSDGPIGAVEQIALERELADRARPAVMRHMTNDMAVIRQVIGRIVTVTASGPMQAVGRDPLGPRPKELPSLSNLNVVLGGEEGLVARWSVTPSTNGERGRLVVTGERGKAVVSMPIHDDWSLDVAGDAFGSESFPRDAEIEHVFWQLMHSIPPEPLYDDTAWLAACRDQEAAEAVDRSLLRGRTIELFHEEHTEAASFKGIMAMGGCLLLVLAMCALLMVTLVEGLRLPLRNLPAWRAWPLFLLVPIGGFLLLQFLGLLTKQRPGAPQVPPDHRDLQAGANSAG